MWGGERLVQVPLQLKPRCLVGENKNGITCAGFGKKVMVPASPCVEDIFLQRLPTEYVLYPVVDGSLGC